MNKNMDIQLPHFKLYYIDEKYVDYLRNFDKIVLFNKKSSRPYVGIVYKYKEFNYFAPLSSPKEKHIKMNSKQIDIYKIDDGKLGIININNMIPTPMECLTEVISNITDIHYKKLLENQLTFINTRKNKIDLLHKIIYFQKQYRENHLPDSILKRTCNFILLEQKCKEWEEHNLKNTIIS